MKLGTVIGNVVATAHHPAYDAKKMMVVKLDDAAVGAPESIIALDQMSAGPGDRVLVMQEEMVPGKFSMDVALSTP